MTYTSPTILVVDPDLEWQGQCTRLLRSDGFVVAAAATAADGLRAARTNPNGLMLLDPQLPDSDGMELIRQMHDNGVQMPFAIVTKHATVQAAISAMRLGAIDIVQKPIDFRELLVFVRRWTGRHAAAQEPSPIPRCRSVAERWASYVLRTCDSEQDLKTIAAWARFLAVSRTTLCETCRLVDTETHMTRDFARMLRVLVKSPRDRLQIGALLDIADARTLNRLLERSGFNMSAQVKRTVISVDQFLSRQRFVPVENDGMAALHRMLALSNS